MADESRESEGADSTSEEPDLRQAADAMRGHVGDLRHAVSDYVDAWLALLQYKVQRFVLFAALLVIGLIFALGLVVTAAVFVCLGIARGLDTAFNSHWLGELITGVGLIAVIAGGALLALRGGMGKPKPKNQTGGPHGTEESRHA